MSAQCTPQADCKDCGPNCQTQDHAVEDPRRWLQRMALGQLDQHFHCASPLKSPSKSSTFVRAGAILGLLVLTACADTHTFPVHGGIGPHTVARLVEDRTVKVVDLNSPGGSVFSAEVMAEEIKMRGLTTYIGPHMDCASACGLVFQAGQRRIMAESALLMYHAPRLPNDHTADRHKFLTDYTKFLTDHGASDQLDIPYEGEAWIGSREALSLGIATEICSESSCG